MPVHQLRDRLILTIRSAVLFLVVGSLLLFSCATTPPVRPLTKAEQLKQDNTTGIQISEKFESHLTFKRDLDISLFLRNLARKLATSTEATRFSEAYVFIIEDKLTQGKQGRSMTLWKNFGVPGIRIYLSAGLLKRVEYENVLAAMVAFQLAQIVNRTLLIRMEEIQTYLKGMDEKDRVEKYGIDDKKLSSEFPRTFQPTPYGAPPKGFTFSPLESWFELFEDEQYAAISEAVAILYRAKYDPRGLLNLWATYQKNPDHSPYSPQILENFIEYTYQNIVQFTPLRNPVIRSNEFVKIQKRIKNL